MATPYDIGLDKNPANFQPLTPLSFLEREPVFARLRRHHTNPRVRLYLH